MASTFMLVWLPSKSINFSRAGLVLSPRHLQSLAQYLDHSTLKKCVLNPKMQRNLAMIQRTWCELAEKEKGRFYLNEKLGNWKCENLTDLSNYSVLSPAAFYPTRAANLWPWLEECPLSSVTSGEHRARHQLPPSNIQETRVQGDPGLQAPPEKNHWSTNDQQTCQQQIFGWWHSCRRGVNRKMLII